MRTTRVVAASLLLAGAGVLAGCASDYRDIEPRPGPVVGLLPAEADAKAEAVRQDPVGYLRAVATKCRTLEQYTLRFIRYERRGLFQRMYGPERIAAWFRRQPFSLRMKWLDEDIKYFESAYVEGREDNKVRFVTRWWSPPLAAPPAVNKVDLQTPVIWGEAKHPLTDFGLERLMERTLASLERAGNDVVVTYEGLLRLAQTDTTVHHLHLAYSENLLRVPVQELYIDLQTDLPAGTILKFASGRIDAAYFYENLNTDVRLTDEDFLLAAERETHAHSAGDSSSDKP